MGGVVSGTGSIIGGIAAKRQAAVEAEFLRRLGVIEAGDVRRENRRRLASQQVAFAASGVDPGSGSPIDVLGDMAAELELAALRTQFSRESSALALKRQGAQALFEGVVSGVGSIVSSATTFGVGGGTTASASAGGTGGTVLGGAS